MFFPHADLRSSARLHTPKIRVNVTEPLHLYLKSLESLRCKFSCLTCSPRSKSRAVNVLIQRSTLSWNALTAERIGRNNTRQACKDGMNSFNPIQAGGHFVSPSPISQHIFKKAWSLELLLCEFSFYVFSVKKSSVPPISPHVCCHGNHATFWLNFENSNLNCFSSISA